MKRRAKRAPQDEPTRIRVEAGVAAYQAFYGRTGAPCPVTFCTEEQNAEKCEALNRIIAEARAAYAGPLRARQAELIEKRDVHRMPYELIARFEKLDLEEVRACLGVAGGWHDPYEKVAGGAALAQEDGEAWHWSKTERFWEPDPNAVFMRVAKIICPEAVEMIRLRVRLGSLWNAEHERKHFGLEPADQ